MISGVMTVMKLCSVVHKQLGGWVAQILDKLELNITPKLAKTGKKDEIEKMGQIE